jgi:hypothetical protein
MTWICSGNAFKMDDNVVSSFPINVINGKDWVLNQPCIPGRNSDSEQGDFCVAYRFPIISLTPAPASLPACSAPATWPSFNSPNTSKGFPQSHCTGSPLLENLSPIHLTPFLPFSRCRLPNAAPKIPSPLPLLTTSSPLSCICCELQPPPCILDVLWIWLAYCMSSVITASSPSSRAAKDSGCCSIFGF